MSKETVDQSRGERTLWSRTYFDGLGREYIKRNEGPSNLRPVIATQTTYNNRGLVASKSLPYFQDFDTPRWITFQYDSMGRLTRQINPDGTSRRQSYAIRKVYSTDENGHRHLAEFDAHGKLSAVREYTGTNPYTLYSTTNYTYDTLGNLVSVMDGATPRNTTTIEYDMLSRKTSMTDPDMRHWTYTYDKNGNLLSQTDARGIITTFTYDQLNRVTLKNYPNDTDVAYSYDDNTYSIPAKNGIGRLTSVVDASGTTAFRYDSMGRTSYVMKTVNGTSYLTRHFYDAMGRVVNILYPDQTVVSYAYDTAGNLSLVDGYASLSDYDAMGRPRTVTQQNGQTISTTTNEFDSITGRLSHVSTLVGSNTIQDIDYSYDAVGNILEINDASTPYGKTTTYTYDHLNRLLTAQCQSSSDDLCQGFTSPVTYTYNPIGNITYNSRVGTYTYSTDHPHAVQQAGPTTYTYDNNGNLQTKVAGGNTTTFTFNDDNRLASIAQNGVTLSCVYDHQGNRVKKTYGGSTTVYIGNLYEVTDGVATKHIFAGGTRVASIRSTIRFTLHKDHLGGLNFATNASGTVAQHDEYMPFGETRLETGTADLRHKFTDQEEDSEFGLYYYGARYYDPVLGRFISPDSIVQAAQDPQTLNRYSYCRNNPLIYTDPNGHNFFDFLKSLFSAVVGVAVTIATAGNFILGGMASGALSSAMNGGDLQNVAFAAMIGGLGSATGTVGLGEDGYGKAIMLGVGGGMTAARGGAQGLANFGAGMMGGYIGYKTVPYFRNWAGGYGFRSNNDVISRLIAEGKMQEAADFAADRYSYMGGTYNPNDPRFSNGSGTVAYAASDGTITYGPDAFTFESRIQAIGFNESRKMELLQEGKWIINNAASDILVNRYQLELDVERYTIDNAWKLDLTKDTVSFMIQNYNYFAIKSHMLPWAAQQESN